MTAEIGAGLMLTPTVEACLRAPVTLATRPRGSWAVGPDVMNDPTGGVAAAPKWRTSPVGSLGVPRTRITEPARLWTFGLTIVPYPAIAVTVLDLRTVTLVIR